MLILLCLLAAAAAKAPLSLFGDVPAAGDSLLGGSAAKKTPVSLFGDDPYVYTLSVSTHALAVAKRTCTHEPMFKRNMMLSSLTNSQAHTRVRAR